MRKQQACYDAKNSTIKKDIVLGKDYNNLLVTNHAINNKKTYGSYDNNNKK